MFEKHVVDLDDTLGPCQQHFSQTHQHFFHYMKFLFGESGPSEEEMQAKHHEVNQRLILAHGFRRTRFPQSLIDTYRFFCQQRKRFPIESEEDTIRGIGYSLFSLHRYREAGLFKGAAETLDFLAERGLLVLNTKGDYELQVGKVEVYGLRKWFKTHIYVHADKNEQTLRAVLQECEPARAVVIGDSPKSDIKPALEVGAYAIHINNGLVWDHEHAELPDAHPRLVRVKTIGDVPRAYEELVERKRKVIVGLPVS